MPAYCIRFLLLTLSLGVCDILAVAEEPRLPASLTIKEARNQTDATGNVVNRQLLDRGWKKMYAFQWEIELEDAARPGRFAPVSPTGSFRNGRRFRLRIETANDLYVYLLVRNSDGSETLLLPEAAEEVPLVRRGTARVLGDFKFSPPAGKEQLRVIASPELLPWISSSKLWKLENGDMLTREQQLARDELRALRHQKLKEQAARQKETVKSTDGLSRAITSVDEGSTARGAQVIAVDESDHAQLVSYLTRDPLAKPVIVHDIHLEHID